MVQSRSRKYAEGRKAHSLPAHIGARRRTASLVYAHRQASASAASAVQRTAHPYISKPRSVQAALCTHTGKLAPASRVQYSVHLTHTYRSQEAHRQPHAGTHWATARQPPYKRYHGVAKPRDIRAASCTHTGKPAPAPRVQYSVQLTHIYRSQVAHRQPHTGTHWATAQQPPYKR